MEIKDKAIIIIKKLVKEGYVAYFAGGYVRDFLMDHPSADIDIATDAPPEKILDFFPHTIPVGLAFGVVIVVIQGHSFEVSTFRKDVNYLNGRKPESIQLSTAREDAIRRDFTINGLFYDPLTETIYDYVGGREDIQKGIIRAIGNPYERFFEDRLRMIRAVRFSAKFGFYIDPETEAGISENAESLFPAVAIERVYQEFTKMRDSKRFDYAIIEMHRLNLLQVIFPDLKEVHLNTIKKLVEPYKYFPIETPTILYLAELFPDYSLEQLKDLSTYLKVSLKELKLVLLYKQSKEMVLNPENSSLVDLARFYANCESDLMIHLHLERLKEKAQPIFKMHQEKIALLRTHIDRIKNKTPLITGDLLKKHGIDAGKKMGALLKEAETLAIQHDLNESEEVLNRLKQSAKWEEEHGN